MASKKGEWFYYDGTELLFGKRNTKSVDLEFGVDLFNLDYALKLTNLSSVWGLLFPPLPFSRDNLDTFVPGGRAAG